MAVPNYFFVRINQRFVRIATEQIQYVISLAHHVKIYTESGVYLPYVSLKELQGHLPQNKFIRVNRGTLVALDKILAFSKKEVWVHNMRFTVTDSCKQEIGAYLSKETFVDANGDIRVSVNNIVSFSAEEVWVKSARFSLTDACRKKLHNIFPLLIHQEKKRDHPLSPRVK